MCILIFAYRVTLVPLYIGTGIYFSATPKELCLVLGFNLRKMPKNQKVNMQCQLQLSFLPAQTYYIFGHKVKNFPHQFMTEIKHLNLTIYSFVNMSSSKMMMFENINSAQGNKIQVDHQRIISDAFSLPKFSCICLSIRAQIHKGQQKPQKKNCSLKLRCPQNIATVITNYFLHSHKKQIKNKGLRSRRHIPAQFLN